MKNVKFVELYTRPHLDELMEIISKEPVTSVNLSSYISFNGDNNIEFKKAQIQFGDSLLITDFDSQTNQFGLLVFDQLTDEYKQKLLVEMKVLMILSIQDQFVEASTKLGSWADKCDEML